MNETCDFVIAWRDRETPIIGLNWRFASPGERVWDQTRARFFLDSLPPPRYIAIHLISFEMVLIVRRRPPSWPPRRADKLRNSWRMAL